MKHWIKIALVCVLSVQSLMAQDVHFTQFYAAPLHLNPAFAGAGVCNRIATSYRTQWMGVPNGFRSYQVSFDHYMWRQKLGWGMVFANDVAGSGSLRRTTISPILAYEGRVAKELTIRAGLQPELGIVNVNFEDLTFGDQIARGGNVASIEFPAQAVSYFDMHAGALLLTSNMWFGISAKHLLSPNEALVNNFQGGILPATLSVHGGYKHLLEGTERKLKEQKSISFAFNYRGQQNFDQLDLGFYYAVNVMNFGMWYRGLPGIKAYEPGYGNSDAIALMVGIKHPRFNLGYSYDFTISKLTNANSGGANELSFSAQLCNPKKRKRKPRSFTPCPSF